MAKYTCLSDIQNDIQKGNSSCLEQVKYFLKNIEEKNTEINAFVEVYTDEALEQAEVIDQKIKEGKAGKLAGMVIGIKDNICYKNHKVTAASKILENFESLYSATVVEKLLAEDAVIIGRLNCDEFAMGSANENSAYGPVKNPLDHTKVPGGSSGASAAAVAADMCLATLGSDTGGSIRQPASFCGVYGLKPTYGRVSRNGLIAFASSLDQIGPFANSIEDIALLTEIISGKDPKDASSSDKEIDSFQPSKIEGKKKIAFLKEYVESEGLDPEIKAQVLKTIETLKAEGHTVEAIDFPYLDYLVPTYYVISTAEASSNLARYDGVHFGYRSEKGTDLESIYQNTRTEGFGDEVKRRILLGTFVLSSGYYDAYYTKAQQVRRLLSDKTKEIFENYDFIIVPTTPHTAFELGQPITDPTKLYLEDIFTVHANLVGNTAISLPIGKHSNGLPFGVQLMADKFKEKELLSFSKYIVDMS
ncbi:MAG: Asp-tRNA(Asn)/Glu-tRNA(Gln) amidotransferase subunit GatA [Flavobacteriales bacterium]|jgi:aspartyl-tRNA(Asn)/glutamyl-tRNA(Gln) amidotransferase subunit A|nr:Asp-tRNA(Asn)/Glu-tRNA(Gln) amidotransferase subunit GatA [Flavobacteriales bacterium]